MSKRIPLTQGKFAIVDDQDFEWLSQWNWYANKYGSTYYAVRNIIRNGSRATIFMHRAILNPPPGMETDHINRDGLDNRRRNLRASTRTQNLANSRKRPNCSSRYKGVSWHKGARKWQAGIGINGRRKHLGYFDDEQEAARAYDKEAGEQFREFAHLNDADPS